MKKQLAQSGTQVGDHAIVIGASISGLLMARVLSSYFTSGQDVHWFHAGYWKLQNKNGTELYCQSRPLLEWHVRKALTSFPNVAFIDNCDVRGICTNEQRTLITGVRLCKREAGAEEESMKADLVIDASGRGSQTPHWLSALGYPQVEEEAVRVELGYASRLVKCTRVHPHGGKALIIYPLVPVTKGAGYLFPVENDQWIVTPTSRRESTGKSTLVSTMVVHYGIFLC